MALIKTTEEIEKMAKAGKIWSKTMRLLASRIKIGVSLNELDKLAEESIREQGGEPAFLDYQPEWAKTAYPATICASVNETVVHGIPNEYKLQNGDILSIDMGVRVDGYNVDAARTFAIGKVSKEAQEILEATKLALEKVMEVIKVGNTLGDIGHSIQSTAEEFGYKVVKGLTGHGIGTEVHEKPTVYNEGKAGGGDVLEGGMCLAIEPMFSAGEPHIEVDIRNRGYVMKDKSLSAHFENTIVVKKEGPEILTKD